MSGKTAESIMATGTITTCTGWVFMSTSMESHMRDSTKMTKKLDMAFTFGQMAESMKDGGTMGDSMVLESIRIQRNRRLSTAYGNMEKE